MQRFLSTALLGAMAFMWMAPAQAADCPEDVPRRYCEHPWFAANRLTLDMVDDRRKFSASWTFEVADNNDIRVVKKETASGETIEGEVMVVGGQRMLARGFEVQEGNELGAVDGPVLSMQLALRLLEFALPAGPRSIETATTIEYKSDKNDLVLATPSADGGFPAPWAVRGKAERAGDSAIRFDMSFEASIRADDGMMPYKIPLKGVWRRERPSPQFNDSMSLEGWTVHRVSVLSSEDTRAYETLGDLRAALEAGR
ncbi:MAG: hypothetical protein WDZ63_02805 [Burkholderiales bacterium]